MSAFWVGTAIGQALTVLTLVGNPFTADQHTRTLVALAFVVAGALFSASTEIARAIRSLKP